MKLVKFELLPDKDVLRDKRVMVNPDQVQAVFQPLPEAIQANGMFSVIEFQSAETISVVGDIDSVAKQLMQ